MVVFEDRFFLWFAERNRLSVYI